MLDWQLPKILKQKWDLSQLFSFAGQNTVTKDVPFEHDIKVTHDETEISKIRKNEWNIYKSKFQKVKSYLHQASIIYAGNTSQDYFVLGLSDLGKISGVENISDLILVPENTKLAEMSCVDEATQAGEFVEEQDLDGNPLGTISDPNVARYMVDLPGSGSLIYECDKSENQPLTHDELVGLENERLDKVAKRIVQWAKKRSIIKFTVTYHCGCGAVNRRLKRNPEICSKTELDTAKQCAIATARKIRIKALELNYNLEVTTAFVGDQQMCKLRPMSLHNAIGTIGCLDSRVLACKLDNLVKANFFDVFIYSDFKLDEEPKEIIDDIVSEAVRNIKLTYHIATGSHGWGDNHFTAENSQRYPVILFAKDDEQEQEARQVFASLSKSLDSAEAKKIVFFLVRTDK